VSKFGPNDILQLAARDPLIFAMVTCWRQGDIAWETMLIQIVVAQQQSVEKYKAELLRALEQKPPTVFLKS
jgi:hypothetical protein